MCFRFANIGNRSFLQPKNLFNQILRWIWTLTYKIKMNTGTGTERIRNDSFLWLAESTSSVPVSINQALHHRYTGTVGIPVPTVYRTGTDQQNHVEF